MKNILIVEDHEDARIRMQSIVEEAFLDARVSSTSTIGKARVCIARQLFDLIVLDLGLPDGKGEELIEEIVELNPNAYIVVSTIHDESTRLLTALKNGAKGYLLKEQKREFLVEAFKGIMRGNPPLAPAVTMRILEFLRNDPAYTSNQQGLDEGYLNNSLEESLTKREIEVFSLLAKGFDRPEIGDMLGISKHTVASHVKKIYGKLGVNNRSEAALLARQMNLI